MITISFFFELAGATISAFGSAFIFGLAFKGTLAAEVDHDAIMSLSAWTAQTDARKRGAKPIHLCVSTRHQKKNREQGKFYRQDCP
ncbi:MAG: hypothetical protein V4724_11700 [Pseudomonadota bacterium]